MTTEDTTTQQKLLVAMASVGYIQKDKKNLHAKYQYLSEEGVKKATQAAFLKAGVMPSDVSFEVLTDDWRTIGKGTQNVVKVRCTIRFIEPGTGSDRLDSRTYQGLGAGVDYGDKATMKAQTSAWREALKNLFCIPSGTDPEETNPERDQAPTQQPTQPSKGGKPASARAKPAEGPGDPGLRTDEQRAEIVTLLKSGPLSMAAAAALCADLYAVPPTKLNVAQAYLFIAKLKELQGTDPQNVGLLTARMVEEAGHPDGK